MAPGSVHKSENSSPKPPTPDSSRDATATPHTGRRSQLRRMGGYQEQTVFLKPKPGGPKGPAGKGRDPKLSQVIVEASRTGGDDDYVRDNVTAAHLAVSTPTEKAGMVVNLLRGFTGDEDEAKILEILRSGSANDTLVVLKTQGHLQWLFDDMHGAEFQALLSIPAQEILVYKLQRLLKREPCDWVISDRDCRDAIAILKSVHGKQRQELVQRIIDGGMLMNFLKEVPAADKQANKVIFDLIPLHLRINVLLSYQPLFDLVVTDAEATEALELLLTVPEPQVDAALAKVKLDKLLAELPDAERPRLRPLANASKDPSFKAKLLKSYRKGETDKAYAKSGADKTGVARERTNEQVDTQTDGVMKEYSRELAKAKAPAGKEAVKAKYTAKLDALNERMAKKLAVEKKHGIYLDAEPQSEIYTTSNLGHFEQLLAILPLRGGAKVITAAQALRALGLALTFAPKHVKGFLPWVELSPLLAKLPAADRSAVKPLFDGSEDAGQKAELYTLLYKASAAAKTAAAGAAITAKHDIEVTAEVEIDEEVKRLTASYEKKRKKVRHDRDALKELNAKYRKRLDALIKRKELELDLEYKYNVELSNKSPRVWTLKDLIRIRKTFEKLPIDHIRDNPRVKELRREKVAIRGGKPNTSIGGDQLGSRVRVYDAGVTGGYRYTGATSEGGEHKAGAKPPRDPLVPLQEVLSHEIGHGVHAKYAAEYTAFRAAVGWGDRTEAQAKTELQADGMLSAAKRTAFLTELESTRSKHHSKREEKVYKGKRWLVDPYKGARHYLVRKDSTLPGDRPGEEKVKKRWEYARSDPADHFAEVYMQFVEVPEQAYETLVAVPSARFEPTKKRYKRLEAKHKVLDKATPKDPRAIAKAKKKMDRAKAKMDKAKAIMDAHVAQWTIMRDQVFKTGGKEAAAIARLNAAATAKPDAAKRAEALGKVSDFKTKHMKKCGTPHQLKRLEEKTLQEIAKI